MKPDETTAQKFIEEIIELCKKYNLSLGHEDTHGSFLVAPYDEEAIKWISAARATTSPWSWD